MSKVEIKGTATKALAGNSVGFFIGLAAVALFGVLAKFLKNEAGLSEGQIALLLAIPSLTGSLLRIPFSAWVETTGGKKPFMVLLLAALIGLLGISVIMTAVQSDPTAMQGYYGLLLIFGAFAGCGVATFSVGITATSYWFPKAKQGTALAQYAGYGNMGPGVFTLLLTWVLLPNFSIVQTYYIWTVLLIIGVASYFVLNQNAWYFQYLNAGNTVDKAKELAKSAGQELFPGGGIKETLLISAKVWQVWVMVFVYFLSFGGFLAITAWFPKYWTIFHGLELKWAGLLTALFSIGTSVFRAWVGPISDKFGGRKITLIFLVVSIIGSTMITLTPAGGIALGFIGAMILALGLGTVNASIFKLVPIFTPTAIGGSSGWIGGLGALGGFVFPLVLVQFLTTGNAGDVGYASGFWVFSIWGVVSFFVTLLLKPKSQN